MEWKEASRIDLETVFDQFEPSVSGMSNNLGGLVTGQILKGVQRTEMMLTSGTTLTGVGELVVSADGIKLQPPSDGRSYYLVKSSISSLINEMEGGKQVWKICLWIFGSVGAFMFILTCYRFYKKYLQEKMSNQVHDDIQAARLRTIADSDQDQEEPEPRPEAVEVAEHSLCVVCLRAEREVILLDCGHVCVCSDCAGRIIRLGHNCPVCRSSID